MGAVVSINRNAPTILFGVLGSLCFLVSGLFLTNNEALVLKNDIEKRLANDPAYLVRAIGSEAFLLGTLAWCSVVNGHSHAVARWWGLGLIPSIWNKCISGDQGGAMTNAVFAFTSLFFGWVWKPLNGPKILLSVFGSLGFLFSGLLLTNNDALLTKNDIEKRLLNDQAFLIRGLGSELFMLGTLAWCSVVNGHSDALARWWAVGQIPSISNKWISGDQGGAMTNAVIALISLSFGWVWKAGVPVKRA